MEVSGRTPLGTVTYGGGHIVATMWTVNEWSVKAYGQELPGMARTLSIMFQGKYTGPQFGFPGEMVIAEYAKMVNGVGVYLGSIEKNADTIF